MPTGKSLKVRTKNNNLFLRVSKGHFATIHSHINYYIDVTAQKTRLSEANAVAQELVSYYNANTVIDTILCLDGTSVIGTCLATELTKENFTNMNAHQTIYIVSPEISSDGKIIFRDSSIPMIKGKNVLILAASVSTGNTVKSALDAIKYYNGIVAGISAIFATVDECEGYKVRSVFNPNDLEGYASYAPDQCPMCKRSQKIDALINSYGFSKL